MVEIRSEVKEIIIYALIFTTTLILIPLFGLIVLKGLTEEQFFDKFLFYTVIGLGMLLIGIVLKVVQIYYPHFGFKYIIHDPEISLLAPIHKYNFVKTILKPFNLFTIFFIISVLAGIYSTATNTFFIGVPDIKHNIPTEQQITPGNQVLFGNEPTVSSENLLFNFLLSMMVGGVWVLKKKFKWDNSVVFVLYIVVILLFAVGWIGLHTLRYGDSEVQLFSTFIFGLTGGFVTLLTGSLIPFMLIHEANNLFFRLLKLYSSDLVITGAVVGLVIYLAIFTITKLIIYSRSKKSRSVIT